MWEYFYNNIWLYEKLREKILLQFVIDLFDGKFSLVMGFYIENCCTDVYWKKKAHK